MKTFNGHDTWIKCLEKINDNILASGSNDKTIKIWNLQENKCVLTLNDHNAPVWDLKKMNDHILASADYDRNIKFWDIKDNFK